MAQKKSSLHLLPLSLAFSFGLVVTTSFPSLVRAQFSQQTLIAQGQGVAGNWNAFNPPNTGLPGGRQEGGGVRGPCPNGSEQLTALTPQTNAGLTASSSPKFFLYIPEMKVKEKAIALPVEFSLYEYTEPNNENDTEPNNENEKDKKDYKTTFTLTGQPGVISFSLPENAPALEVGKNYYWSFSLICESNQSQPTIIRGGWIKRSELSSRLKQELQKATPLDRPSIYAREALWFDTVTSLAELRVSNPGNLRLAEQWEELLKSVELENLSQEPFVECCKAEQ